MRRNNLLYFLVIFTAMIVFAPFLHAQDPGTSVEEGAYDLTVDEALDQVEGDVDRVQNDEVLSETGVEVLEAIVIDEDNRSEEGEALETKIIPLLHAEASSIIDILDQMKSPKGEIMYNEDEKKAKNKPRIIGTKITLTEDRFPLRKPTFVRNPWSEKCREDR